MKNEPSVDHDFVGRLTDTDTKMLHKCTKDLLFTDEIDSNSTISPSPQHENTTFMTDEKMKKILMPKKIEF